MNGSCDAYLASSTDLAGADDITNLAKKREPGDIERTPQSFIITGYITNVLKLSYQILTFEYNEINDTPVDVYLDSDTRILGYTTR